MQFREQRKLGDQTFIAKYEKSLARAINRENQKFCKKNERKKKWSKRGPWASIAGISFGAAAAVGFGTVAGVGAGAIGGLTAGLTTAGCVGMPVGVAVGYATKKILEYMHNYWNKTEKKKTKHLWFAWYKQNEWYK